MKGGIVEAIAGPVTNMWRAPEPATPGCVEYRVGRAYIAVRAMCVQARDAAVATGEKGEEVL